MSERLSGEQTNNRAELTAIMRAMSLSNSLRLNCQIFTDSAYCMDILAKIKYSIGKNDFKVADKNMDLISELF